MIRLCEKLEHDAAKIATENPGGYVTGLRMHREHCFQCDLNLPHHDVQVLKDYLRTFADDHLFARFPYRYCGSLHPDDDFARFRERLGEGQYERTPSGAVFRTA